MREGFVKQAVTIAALQMQQMQDQFSARFDPLEQFYQRQHHDQLVTSFFGKYPHLKPYETIVMSVANQLKANGFSGTLEEGFQQTAQHTLQVLQAAGITVPQGGQPQTPPAAQGQQQQPQTPPASPMQTLSGAGQSGGAGAGGGGGQPKSPGMAVFD